MKSSILAAKDLIKSYHWSSVFFKYFKWIFCIVMIPFLLVCSFFYASYSGAANRELAATYEKSVSKSVSAFDNVVREMDNVFLAFSSNNNIVTYLLSDSYIAASLASTTVYARIEELIRNAALSFSYIESIHIYSARNGYVLSSKNAGRVEDFYARDVLAPFIDARQSVYVVPTGFNAASGTYRAVTFGYAFQFNSDPAGVLAISVHYDKLKELVSKEANEDIQVLDGQSRVVFASSQRLMGQAGSLGADAEGVPPGKVVKRGNQFVGVEKLANETTFIMRAALTSERANWRGLFAVGLLLAAVSLFAPLLVSFYSSWQFYKVIAAIAGSIQTLNGQDDGGADEISFISKNILRMAEARRNAETELVGKIAKLKAIQSVALQLQINPHFLFNTLNFVSMVVTDTIGEENDAEKVLALLASLLHAALDTNNYMIETAKELENAQKYIEIESYKYLNGFDVVWDVDDAALPVKTVKLILQPLVENALEHGIRPLSDFRGVIKIGAKAAGGLLKLTVSNNGVMIPPEKLAEIRDRLRYDDMPKKDHIGLFNVNQRIKLIYGDAYGCGVASEAGWTTVTAEHPA